MSFTFSLLLTLIISTATTATLAHPLSLPQQTSSFNSHFCRCDTEGKDYTLVRVDISEGKKYETKVRTYPKDSFTLPQCEGWITEHPSCK